MGAKGLDIIDRNKNGLDVKELRVAKTALKVFRNPLGVAKQAGHGIYKEAKSEGIANAKSWLSHE